MSDIVNEIPETLKPIARTVWENVAHLMGDYSEVPFDQVLVRPRYQGVRGTLRHLAQRLDELTILASDHQDLINVVAELGIEDSSTTPAEAVRELKAEIERLGILVERMTAALELIAGTASDKLQAAQARAALPNIGQTVTSDKSS